MKRIILKELRIKNFKGVLGERVIQFNEDLTKVFGANETGKTTLADAFLWCWFGKNSEDDTKFGIKPKDSNGIELHNLEYEVESIVLIDNAEFSFKRGISEVWSKPKGVEESVLTGNKGYYFLDGNKVTESDFKKAVDEVCPESLFKAITNASYFTSLSSDAQRALLIKMAGEVTLEEAAQGVGDCVSILETINKVGLQTFKSNLSYKKGEIDKALKEIPVRISQENNGIQEPKDCTDIENSISLKKKEIESIDAEIKDKSLAITRDYEAKAETRNNLAAKKQALRDIENKANSLVSELNNAKKNRISEIENRLIPLNSSLKLNQSLLESSKNSLSDHELKKQAFREEWTNVDTSTIQFKEDEFICPTCKRPLDNIEDSKATMIENFNLDKADKLDKLEKKASDLKKQELKYSTEIAKYKGEIENLTTQIESITKELSDAKNEVVKSYEDIIKESLDYPIILSEIKTLEDDLTPKEEQATDSSLEDKRKVLQSEIDNLNKEVGEAKAIETSTTQAKRRIEKLKEEQKTLSQQLSDLQKQEFLFAELNSTYMKMLEDRVNKLFTVVKFRMFELQVNGAEKPTCEATINGVPFKDLNNASKINAGIDIINAMCKHNQVYAPCFIDNAEAVNVLFKMESQMIQLIVSEDKKLRIV